jgi:hypothetical protein
LLGLGHVPVAAGTAGVTDSQLSEDLYYGLKNTTFENQPWNTKHWESGNDLIRRLAEETRVGQNGMPSVQPLTVLLISSLQDIGEFFLDYRAEPEFLRTNFKKFVSQGGYKVETSKDGSTKLVPDMAAMNNTFNRKGSKDYHDTLGLLRLRSDAWSREVAKAAKIDSSLMKALFSCGPIGKHLEWLWMRQEFKFFWDANNLPFMPRLNLDWYLETRLGLSKDSEEFKELRKHPDFSDMIPRIKVIAYDCCAAVGTVGDDFMREMGVLTPSPSPEGQSAILHRVFGDNPKDLGGINAEKMAEVMQVFLLCALQATQATANELIDASSVQHHTVRLDGDVHKTLSEFDTLVLPKLKELKELEYDLGIKKLGGLVEAAKEKESRSQEECEELDMLERQLEAAMETLRAKEVELFPDGVPKPPYEALFQREMGTLPKSGTGS